MFRTYSGKLRLLLKGAVSQDFDIDIIDICIWGQEQREEHTDDCEAGIILNRFAFTDKDQFL